MKKTVSLCCFAGFVGGKAVSDNPLLEKFDTPFGVPPFDRIKEEHYLPAFYEGIRQHQAEIERIANDPEAPSFSNTIEALEKSGQFLDQVSSIFSNLLEANTNDVLNGIAEEITPKLSEDEDAVYLNDRLYGRVKAVYESPEKERLDTEQQRVLKCYYDSFVRGGADLLPEKKERLKAINSELALLEFKFGDNQLKETNAYRLIIDDPEDLKGLPEGLVSAAADAAGEEGMEGRWVFTLHNPSIMPFLQYADSRELRERIYRAYIDRGSNDNANNNWSNISRMVSLRAEKAQLLGFPDYASYVIDDNMAKTTDNVYRLCRRIWDAALPKAKAEAAELQEMIDREGGAFKLAPWDWRYYSEKLKMEKYGLDQTEISQYFPLEQVREGAFYVANKLYGVTFTRLYDLPLPHPDAMAFRVQEADGSRIGILYVDYFPRAGKSGGAWMDAICPQSALLDSSPVVINVCNFTRPVGEVPSLLTVDEVCTLFHEFGHALHGLFSRCTYPSVAGTSVASDFVELPSQVMENWALEPEVLKVYARHWKTGEPMPQELVAKLQESALFGQGFAVVEFMSAALLDMAYHSVRDTAQIDAEEFEEETLKRLGLIPEITVRYRGPYFGHIFSGGYSAGYYSYTWAEVLDADAYEAFRETGDIFNRRMACLFRENILSKGGSDDPMKLYRQFRGKEPDIKPLLRRKGLL